jgi:hypothetical protein
MRINLKHIDFVNELLCKFNRRELCITLSFLIAISIFLIACKESLPTRNDPTNLFYGYLDVKYSLLWNENALRIGINVSNIYDETIQARASLQGTVDVTLISNTLYNKTIKFTDNNLVSTKKYNSATKELTLDPGDSITFVYTWNFVDNNNVDLTADVFRYYRDPDCTLRYIAYSESFAVSGTFQIIENLEIVKLKPKVFNLCYVTNYVLPKYCGPPTTNCPQR